MDAGDKIRVWTLLNQQTFFHYQLNLFDFAPTIAEDYQLFLFYEILR